jgi:IPT/TIG domain
MKKLVALSIIISFASCTEEEVTSREFTRVKTSGVTDINETGATFQAIVASSPVPVTDHGFLWHDQTSPLFENADRISLGPVSQIGPYQALCERGLSKGKKYYVRGYAVSDNNIVYGNVIEFTSRGSKPPSLSDFNPKVASWGDTIIVSGENFSVSSTKNVVKFDASTAIFIDASSNFIRVKVPYDIQNELTSISIVESGTGHTSTLSTDFRLLSPIITSVTPSSAPTETTVVIEGKYLGSTKKWVYFNAEQATIINTTQSSITCKVPPGLPSGLVTLKVITGNDNLFTSTSFEIK